MNCFLGRWQKWEPSESATIGTFTMAIAEDVLVWKTVLIFWPSSVSDDTAPGMQNPAVGTAPGPQKEKDGLGACLNVTTIGFSEEFASIHRFSARVGILGTFNSAY